MNPTARTALLALAAMMGAGGAGAQAPAPIDPLNGGRSLQAARLAAEPPVIDGRLDDTVWAMAAVARDFVQYRPNAGTAAVQKTEARVLYDDQNVYVAMRMYDSAPDSIAAQLARRDATGIFSDWADVIIDSYHDRRSGYRFSVNPRGVLKDVYHYNDGSEDVSWDAVWEAKTGVDAEGWTAEFRIPLSQLRFTPSESGAAEQVWGIQFGRLVARTEEQSFWAPVLPQTPGFMSLAGDLRGVQGLGSPKRLEVLPYTVSKVTRAPEPGGEVRSPFWKANDPGFSAGADIKYGISSNLTLTGTINPDFGQVEADPSVVNLSAFETFFPERRPFFLEGSSLFSFGVGDEGNGEQLFYSRRIGRTPQRSSFDADYTSLADATTILGAAKLTGRTAGGWSIGVFDALTQAENARIFRDHQISTLASEPLTNYGVARLSRDFRGGLSSAGIIFTATNRDLHDDAFAFLRSSAYTVGLNGRHRFGRGNGYQVGGYLAGSSIYGDTLSIQLAQLSSSRYFQRPDAEHLEYDPARTSLQGLAGEFAVSKLAGRVTGGIATRFRTPGFEINDVGFQSGADNAFLFGWVNYNVYTPGRVLRNWRVGLNPSSGWDFGGTRLWTQLNFSGNAMFQNFWSVNFWGNQRWRAWSTTALRGGPAIVAPGTNNWSLNLSSDRRRPVTASMNLNGYLEHGTDSWRNNFNFGIGFRPSSQVDVQLNPSYGVSRPAWQYVTTTAARNADGSERAGEREYVFAALDQTTLSLTTRVSYTATPTLSFQFYAQPFVSAGDYTTFRRVRDPRAQRFSSRFQDFGGEALSLAEDGGSYRAQLDDARHIEFGNPDFSVRQLRSNAVLRWEYRPGSTLFLVWSQGRSGYAPRGDFSAGRDLDNLMGDPATNVLLVKLSYWLNF